MLVEHHSHRVRADSWEVSGPDARCDQVGKAWDLTFRDELPGPEPDAFGWARKDQWSRQLKQYEPIATPDSFEAIVQNYTSTTP